LLKYYPISKLKAKFGRISITGQVKRNFQAKKI